MEDTIPKYLLRRVDDYARRCCVKEIQRITSPISYNEFLFKYLIPNVPCIFGSWATKEWLSIQNWVRGDGSIDRDLLISKFGSSQVPVVECKDPSNSQSSKYLQMNFLDYISHVIMEKKPCLYLKDWHCSREHSNYKFYDNPIFFQSDWLNEFYDDKEDDYKFVYYGPKGSWTPKHADVLRSYSWSANISGKKKWIINSLCFELENKNCDYSGKYEVIQEKGEIIFIPSGWFHEVHNLEETISINHNWLNAFNIDICWNFMKEQLASVKSEITKWELDNIGEDCQKILRADVGMDYGDFYNFLHFIAIRRITFLHKLCNHEKWHNSINTLITEHNFGCEFKIILCKEHCKLLENELSWYVIDLKKIVHLLDVFVKECGSLDFNAHSFIICKCACQPMTFLNLLNSFNSIALSSIK